MNINTERDAKNRVRELVLHVKHSMGLTSPPHYRGSNDPIAAYLKIKVKETSISYGDGGMYLPSNPPRIVINPTDGNQERLNFTFFHEILHHLIREDDDLYAFLHEFSPKGFQSTLEHYCNIGAAEFLVPSEDVRQIISNRGFGIELIRELDESFPASKPACAIQLAQCAPHSCVIVICEYGVIPKKNDDDQRILGDMQLPIFPQLFVRYSSGSPAYKYNTGRYIPIPKNHVIETAYQTRKLVKGQDNIPVHSGKGWLTNCEAFFYKGNVYAVFNVTDPPSKNQKAFAFL